MNYNRLYLYVGDFYLGYGLFKHPLHKRKSRLNQRIKLFKLYKYDKERLYEDD